MQIKLDFIGAERQQEINDLRNEYKRLKEQARYLYGNRKGQWGRSTQADEKRTTELHKLNIKINSLLKHKTK